MSYLSVDYLVVYAFLAISLIIGLLSGGSIKDIREYAIANKTFGTGALVLTLLATNIAGATLIDGAALVFSQGIIFTIALLTVSISFLITGLFIAPKAAKFGDCLTMGDLMKRFYGPYSGIIAGLLGLLCAVLLVGMELKVLGIMFESLLAIPAKWGLIIGGIIIAIYSAHGGIKSVTVTDIFQFIILAIFIPLIAYIAVNKIGGVQSLFRQVPAEKFEIFGHEQFSYHLTLFLMWIIPAGMIDPAIIQRLLMAKRGSQLRNQYLLVAAFDPVYRLVVMLIGLSAVVLYPYIEGKQVVAQLIHGLLPKGLKGCVIAGVLAVGMSSISSYMHAAGLSLSHDVIKPIYPKKAQPMDEVKNLQEYWKRIGGRIAHKMGISLDEFDKLLYEKNAKGDWIEFADHAKKIKWVDYIISGIQDTAKRELPDLANYDFCNYITKYYGRSLAENEQLGTIYLPKLAPNDFYCLYNPDNRYQLAQ